MFKLDKRMDKARLGRVLTPHGTIETPAFMNVGTQGAIKGGLSGEDLECILCQVLLCNTYHLHLRPGDEVVRALGGLQGFCAWDKPILTDSGGFQVFSLSGLRKISEEGVAFASHIDGRRVFMGPEESMRVQANLGATIAMAFDECVANPCEKDAARVSAERTVRWLARCKTEHEALMREEVPNQKQLLFGINQGGTYVDLRCENMKRIADMELDGYAVGGLAVGETAPEMYAVLDAVEEWMPPDKPRYLMGVGTPENIVEAVARGIDLFDCVLPARNARHGHLFTRDGVLNLNNQKYATDAAPIDSRCDCPTCARYSRAYLRHLLRAGEVLGLRLCVRHNLYFYNQMFCEIRESLAADTFSAFSKTVREAYSRRI